MEKNEIIKNIAKRSGGDIYLGVVGAVRTGKSTFIKRVIETLVVPNIEDEYEKKRALDEIPQSAAGKTFVPNNTAKIKIDDVECNIKLIDCVGYMINNAIGATDENGPRMVKTPWYNEEIPFTEAAEIGTEKVIKEHSTIGIVVTSDGSIGEFQRDDYIDAEKRVIETLVVPNIEDEYEKKRALDEIPQSAAGKTLNPDNKIKKSYIDTIKESVVEIDKIKDVDKITNSFLENEYIEKAYLSDIDTSTGIITVTVNAPKELYNETLKELINVDIKNKADLLNLFQEYNTAKKEYDEIKYALKMVKQTGYGIATPSVENMKLDKPEIIKQGTRYGVKLKAVAPSIHMIRVDVESTFEPIIGSEVQSKELIDYLTKNDNDIWKSEIFGRSLDSIVQEGIQSKINLMPDNIRYKLQNTLTKVVNKGSNNVITIVI